jgi:hypothetical protein
MSALHEAIAAAWTDPAAARQLLTMFTAFSRRPAYFHRTRGDLIGARVPEQFLPTYDEINYQCGAPAPTKPSTTRSSPRRRPNVTNNSVPGGARSRPP